MRWHYFKFMVAALLGAWCGSGFDLDAADTLPDQDTESRFLSRVRQLTFEGRRSGEGYFASDQKALIFQSERQPENPFYQIYYLDLESGDSHRVSPGLGKTTCAFFRPGTDQVLFASTHLNPEARAQQKAELEFRAAGKSRRYSWDYDPHMDIFSSRRDGSGLQRLTDSMGYDAEAAYSPDGSKIVFCSLRSAYPTNALSAADLKRMETDPAWFGDIYLMNADGTGQKRLTTSDGYDGGPFFSPDGQRIVWRRFSQDGVTADVYTMKLDGTDVRRLTDFKAMSWAPYFHPSGAYVIFTANKMGFSNFELYMVDAAGTKEPVRVTFTDGFDGLPVFAPDGRQLSWTSGRGAGGQSQLYLARWNHQAALAALGAAGERGSESITSIPPRKEVELEGFAPSIQEQDLQRQVEYLASPELEGRMTGTVGNRLAADYIVQHLKQAGLQSMNSDLPWRQNFEFTATIRVKTNQNHLTIQADSAPAETFKVNGDFRPMSFSANGEVKGDVVFVGYGLTVPGEPGEGYDSYAGLNVSNKIVLAFRYVPEAVDQERRAELNRYAGLRYKAMLARNNGASAVLFVTGPNSPNAGKLAGMSFDGSLAGSGIVAATVSSNVVASLLKPSKRDLVKLQTALDTENPHAETGFEIKDVKLLLKAEVEHIKKRDNNILAYLPPQGGSEEVVMIGAHYDHLGHGETGGMNRAGEENQIHPGADDNASGVAAVMEVAAALAQDQKGSHQTPQRGLLVALWSGEELGLLGSSHFAENPPVPLSNIVAYLNFDMVGRLRDNKLNLQGIGSSSVWRKMIEKRNVAAGFNLVLQDDPYLPTDVTAFYPKSVPVMNFFTGSHEEYHRPADTPDTVNYEGLERIASFARGIVKDLLIAGDRPDYVKVERSGTGGSRDRLRVYLGTIPDYATEVQGVKLSGVRAGAPAEKAGLKGGDVIVEFAGQKIANIYDYTYALDAVKIGKPVSVVVMRAGKKVTIEVVPEARE